MGRFREVVKVALIVPQVGLTISVCVASAIYLGFQVDNWTGLYPFFSVLMGILGVITGVRTGYKILIRSLDNYGKSKKRDSK